MQRSINVLMVTEFPLDDPAGGINTMLHTLAGYLRSTCRIVWLENDWNASRLTRKMVNGELRCARRLPSPYSTRRPLYGFVAWLLRFPATLWSLRQLLRAEAIDVVHLHYASPYQYWFRLARTLFAIPYIITLHRGDIMTFPKLEFPDQKLVRYAVNGSAAVIAVSRWLAEQTRSTLGDIPSLEVIENGIDVAELDRLVGSDRTEDGRTGLPQHGFFLMVSNVTRYKAQDVAIRAWELVKEHHPDVPLLIIGGQRELWDECLRLIEQLGCEDSVRLLGPRPRKTALDFMRRAAAVIIPSRSEGLPYVLLEAGALGTPVICSDIGPFIEVVEDGKSALVAPVEDHRALARAVLRLIETPELGRELGQRLSERVRANFSGARMAERYLKLYYRALQRDPPQSE